MRLLLATAILALCAQASEFHVSVQGNDAADGSAGKPFRTISAAARVAQAGDTITVHAGTYRERVTPPRGGVVYQAASGETVVLKGSEVVRDWKQFAPGVWKAVLPNSFFGAYNPYKDLINGDWFTSKGRPHHTGEVYLNGKALFETHLMEQVLHPKANTAIRDAEGSTYTWFAEVDDQFTYIYANFHDKDPNREPVEINVRDACFYPDQPGRDNITVRGFRMAHAATQWAAPTAEQIGLIGTHWSKGWIIENNVISDSKCVCISLGKDRATGHNVWNADPRKDGATHYNEVILRALEAGWSREKIGSHIVRNNVISNCEQAGIVGSLGAVFSQIDGNDISSVWTKRQFTGAEMAGIKLHAAIDVVIRNNRIHDAGRGIWLDWMAQGTRVSSNLLYDNSTDDLFVEVDHGPFVVDNNLFLSKISLLDMSEGGAYAHNLFAGQIVSRPEPRRSTPYHKAHSTALAGLNSITGGDDRFYNNLFLGNDGGLWVYNHREYPLFTGGNVYGKAARGYVDEKSSAARELSVELVDGKEVRLTGVPAGVSTCRVTTEMLGKARVSGLAYDDVVIDKDYFGKPRDASRPTPGPFEGAGQKWTVWK